jgi:hypothetical protein
MVLILFIAIFFIITPSSQLQMENVSSLSISTLQEICNSISRAQSGQLLLLVFLPQRFKSYYFNFQYNKCMAFQIVQLDCLVCFD